MTWGAIGGAAVAVVGNYVLNSDSGSSGGGGGGGGGGAPAQMADPFGSQRWQYQQQLSRLMSDPNAAQQTVANLPGYQYQLDTGRENINRKMGAAGMGSSGNNVAAQNDFAQQLSTQDYFQYMSLLAGLSGVNVGSPGAAGQIQANQNAATAAGYQQLWGAAGNAAGNWFGNWVNGSSSGGGDAGGTTSGGGMSDGSTAGGGMATSDPFASDMN